MYTFLHNSWKAYSIFGIINLNILINMQFVCLHKSRIRNRENLQYPLIPKGIL